MNVCGNIEIREILLDMVINFIFNIFIYFYSNCIFSFLYRLIYLK